MSASSNDNTPFLTYMGTNNASHEGERHFFILKSINSKYIAVNGKKVEYFLVYTSTGVNTKGICGTKLCIIPCFGSMNKWSEDHKTIHNVIIKIDYYKGIYSHILKDEPLLKNYEANKSLFLGTVSNSLLRQFFNDKDDSIHLSEFEDLKVKLGSDAFLKDIIIYRDSIYNYIKEGKKIYFQDLSELNKFIKDNNFYGIDLSGLMTYDMYRKKYASRNKYNGEVPELFFSKLSDEDKAIKIKEKLKCSENDSPDKYSAMLNSPTENTIYKALLKK
jgi:hypothetical protein